MNATKRDDDVNSEAKSISRASDDAIGSRKCRICGFVKSLSAFRKFKKCKLGRGYVCKPCDNARMRKWHANNQGYYDRYKDKYRERQAAYWRLHPEKNRAKASRALKKASASLADSYIRRKLRDLGVPADMRSPELIEAKRQALIAKRLAAELRGNLKDVTK